MNPDVLLLDADVELQAAAGDGGKKVPRVSILAYSGGLMTVIPHGPVAINLSGLELPATVPLVTDHENRVAALVGQGEPIVRGGELHVTGCMSSATDAGRTVLALARDGVELSASVGLEILASSRVWAGKKVVVNGRSLVAPSGGLLLVERSRLREISLLPVGADAETSVQIAARAAGVKGIHHMEKTQEEIAAEATKAERERLQRIEAACAGFSGPRVAELRASAIAGDLSESELNTGLLEVLRASRPTPPSTMIRDGGQGRAKVLEAAALMTTLGDGASVLKTFDERTLEGAGRLRGLGIQELAAEAALLDGVTLPRFRTDAGAWLRAGFSTVSLPGILSNVANKVLYESFTSVEQVWRLVAKRSSVSNFKSSPRYRLTADLTYVKVGPGGELKHGTLGEQTWSMKADTFGRMISIPRQTIIDDDMGAFAELPMALGRGAGLALNVLFWTIFLDNSTFFTAARGNYAEGAGTVLSIDGLTAAEILFLDQTDGDGNPLGIIPKLLLVPTDLGALATQLVRSLEIRDPSASGNVPIVNPHAEKFTAAASTYLKNANYTGASSKAWYLLADPNVLPVIEVAFLDGKESPTVETAQADFNTLGIQMRGYHDFGVSLADHRGGVKMKGEA